jgi:hypothetical protein
MTLARPTTIETRPGAAYSTGDSLHGDGAIAASLELREDRVDHCPINRVVHRPAQAGLWGRHGEILVIILSKTIGNRESCLPEELYETHCLLTVIAVLMVHCENDQILPSTNMRYET